ncbi:MAG TPA: hypothetical protein DC054_07770 [Blastocatellia bacterium]|nr:hypothetical protein [Blastocatellia bacterium]
MDRLDEKFSRQLEAKLPGWKHERGEPMQGSKNVLIQYWSSSNRKIKITIIPQKSAQEAREKMEGFAKNTKGAEELKGFGDEAYSWGYAGSNVVFRKGRFAVFVSTYAEVESDTDAQTLSRSEKGDRERAEMKRLSKEFAKHVVTALDEP